jgi:DNA-binding GntR family transcriptional regulator
MPAESVDLAPTATPQLVTGPSLADQAYWAVREMITTGALRRGQRITERALGDQLGVSATPIREAFRRLEHERLIERLDGRSVTVSDPSHEDLAARNLIQAALRGVAARLAATAATDQELAEIQAAYAESRNPRAARTRAAVGDRIVTTRQFHELIDRAAHSPLLVDMIATAAAFDLEERVRAAETLGHDYPAELGLDEHGELLDALVARNADRAEKLMRAHIERTGALFLSVRDGTADAATPRRRRRGQR